MNKKKESKVVPNVRFKGFTDDWKQRKLTEIVNRVNKSSNSDVLPKVEFEDIVSGEGRLNKDISSKFDSRKGTLFEPENILYGKLRPYLKNWLFSDFEGVALGDFWVFEATDVSVPSFDYYLIQSDDYQKVANDTSGTKMPRSDWKNVSSTDFAIPSKDEQKQIGAFFKQLDDTITLHQQKITLLIKLKKAMLEKMFPKKGTVIPEFRFNGFANAWEQRKFSELYARSSEKNDGSIGMDKNITVAIMQFKNDVKVSTTEYLKTYYTFKLGDIAFEGHQSKEFRYGRFVENDIGNGIVSHIFAVFRPIQEYDLYFWKYAINNEALMQRILARSTKASTMMHDLVTNDFLNETFLVPSVKEQKQIGAFLNKLDNLITLHQRKLDMLKKLKSACLSEMFI
ncbi:restriction endonuclease subunit S [Ligilactobacillus ruminis]|uniref:restriction endonuclease subunit S n=3 Tax=Ligilactobacillus ruminis TaxID=1623 RepID=UPI0012AEF49D|nr:restriction endonuclease subunit S [Ligilactobacillus ruminis]MSA85908.1 restriction endonuclease subunit S [Ligilactobacillus ruminis]